MRNKTFIICLVIFVVAIATKAQTGKALIIEPKVILENDKLKVTEYNSKPGQTVCGQGKHSHPAHLTVLLTAANVKITTADGKTIEQKVPVGTTFWSEAETHIVMNNGTKPIKAYIVEIK